MASGEKRGATFTEAKHSSQVDLVGMTLIQEGLGSYPGNPRNASQPKGPFFFFLAKYFLEPYISAYPRKRNSIKVSVSWLKAYTGVLILQKSSWKFLDIISTNIINSEMIYLHCDWHLIDIAAIFLKTLINIYQEKLKFKILRNE
jgi:hypothetical protein